MTNAVRMSLVVMIAVAFGGLLAPAAVAQDLGVKAPPQNAPVLIHNASIHPMTSATIAEGWVLFDEGVIQRMGEGKPPRMGDDVVTVDAEGMHVYPGLIGSNTVMGLVEIGAVRATIDYAEVGAITPEVRAAVSINPDSTIIPVTRSNGVLTVAVLPLGGVLPGRASVVRMDGWTWEDMAIESEAGLLINWPNVRPTRFPGMRRSEAEQRESIREAIAAIDRAFEDAAAYIAAREADPDIPVDLRWEAMREVVSGSQPVFIRANEYEQMQSAIGWCARRGLSCVIIGGRDAARIVDHLKRYDVGVILTGTHRMPKRRDSSYDEIFRLPQLLEEAGVRWCLATSGGSFQTPHERNLPYHAASAVAYGLDPEVAVQSITIRAAEMLGVGDQLGSIDAGKAATLIVTTGNPLEITTSVELAFIDGRSIDLSNKQTVLYEKYREKYRQLELID